ncbi:intermembrane space AAA protease IAP-1 [Aspergillus karnatakaensis]|uniref:i-AAA protease YME1 n=1 Tax=Aspergillus karnatakaensis TaxID=1810916 RepID=UPI003CCDB846
MAFQLPIFTPSISAMVSSSRPSVSKLVTTPWNGVGKTSAAAPPTIQSRRIHLQRPARIFLPDFLASASSETLATGASRTLIDRLPRSLSYNRTLWAAPSPTASRYPSLSTRTYSTVTPLSNRAYSPINPINVQRLDQKRFLFGGPSYSLLAQKEKTANNNPNSANAQNAFYQALLRANMPAIVIERYRSGHFTSNVISDAIYQKALERVGGTSAVPAPAVNQAINPEQAQIVGQAIAAQNAGGQVAISSKQPGTGAKDAPLHVVVEESFGSTVFRWVKFFVTFAFVTYLSLVLITVIVETTGVLKNIKGPPTNQAQPEHQTARFSDVHGCDEAKDELQELVEFLLNPERFSSLGGKLPKGVLLVGPPGTGKTLLARAVAGEAGVPFFYMSGSEFDEVYVGVGAKRVRELFTQARTKSPAIIFIDELDAIGARRNERDQAYVKQTLNQLLTELDGFSQTTGVIILAATNYPELLDKALTRPGRFDRKVVVDLPDVRGRMEILKHHMKNVQIGTDVDVATIARGTPGFSGADLENLVNQAAIYASRNKQLKVLPKDFDYAKDKIMMGAESRSRVIQDKDKLLTAYHEAGHALVAYFSPSSMPLYKITIVPRGMALGVTHFLPEMDMVSKSYIQYLSDIDVSMGGKAAEEIVFGEDQVTSGISQDLRNATQTAFTLVTRFGYSKKLGNVDLTVNYDSLSSETKQEIEAEVRRLVEEARQRAVNILTERRHELELLTKALIEYETLTKEEMEKVLKGEKLDKLTLPSEAPLKLPESLKSANLTTRPGVSGPRTSAD